MQAYPNDRERGSVLLVALIFSVIIAISLNSFISLGKTNLNLSLRSFYGNSALNLAESGLEQAMWSINEAVEGGSDAWTGWTVSGDNAWKNFTGLDADANAAANVRVYVQNHTLSAAPVIIARSTITPVGSSSLEKWIKVRLTKRSVFANGLVARNSLRFSGGNAEVDSYDSRLGPYDAPLGMGLFNKYDRGSAGSASISVSSFTLSNSKIFGFAAIGTSDYSGLSVGPNGIIGSFGGAAGTIDYGRVATDFVTNFADVTAPSTAGYTIGAITSATVLPLGGHLPAADGKFYYNISSISLSGGPSKTLNIAPLAHVVIRITAAPGYSGVKLTGNASINVLPLANLEMYVNCDVDIAGRGIANLNSPDAFHLRSTKVAGSVGVQDIKISGNGQLSAVVYAPNADVTLNGGGSSGGVFGSIIADNISVTGGSSFHYDESLPTTSSGSPFGVSNWQELTTVSQRAAYSGLLSF